MEMQAITSGQALSKLIALDFTVCLLFIADIALEAMPWMHERRGCRAPGNAKQRLFRFMSFKQTMRHLRDRSIHTHIYETLKLAFWWVSTQRIYGKNTCEELIEVSLHELIHQDKEI